MRRLGARRRGDETIDGHTDSAEVRELLTESFCLLAKKLQALVERSES